eukprot:symbB.v1.2.039094.t1/scaffold6345.1/size23479/2
MGIVGTLAALLAQNRSRLEAADPVQLSGFTELCMLGPPCSGPSTPMKWAAKGVRFGRPGGTPNQLMAGTSGWLALQRFQTTAAILLLSATWPAPAAEMPRDIKGDHFLPDSACCSYVENPDESRIYQNLVACAVDKHKDKSDVLQPFQSD